MAFELYISDLTTKQVGNIFGKVYGHAYSKAAISSIMTDARTDVFLLTGAQTRR